MVAACGGVVVPAPSRCGDVRWRGDGDMVMVMWWSRRVMVVVVVVAVVVSSLLPRHGGGGDDVVWSRRVVVSSFPPRHGSAVHSPNIRCRCVVLSCCQDGG